MQLTASKVAKVKVPYVQQRCQGCASLQVLEKAQETPLLSVVTTAVYRFRSALLFTNSYYCCYFYHPSAQSINLAFCHDSFKIRLSLSAGFRALHFCRTSSTLNIQLRQRYRIAIFSTLQKLRTDFDFQYVDVEAI